MYKRRQTRPVTIEKEHEDDAQGQFENTAADLRAARQQPVTHLPQIRLERHHHRRALLIDAVPDAYQPLAHKGNRTQPDRCFGQPLDLRILDECGGIAHMIGEVETQPHQRCRYQHHPAQRQQCRRQRLAAIEPTGQQAHQRPTGKRQDRAPEHRRPERRHHPEARAEQHHEQDLHQQAIVIDHQKSRKSQSAKE
ncbi:hypothetical protein D3C87_1114470 [compost metagenome]